MDRNGVGDTPYVVGKNNIDHFPLMKPVVIPEFPIEETPPDHSFDLTSPNIMLPLIVLLTTSTIIFGTVVYKRRASKTLGRER
ncbi:MAG: hypothetical protein QXZ68_07360 [Candidatus Bathyarchaeia archaeon]